MKTKKKGQYRATIGLEIHAELKTESKMFCSCFNDPLEKEPNKNICPICLGHPGTLPVINKKAVEHVLKTGLALNCQVQNQSKFDRKNYFYPDLPKGYQISQYDLPLVKDGFLEIEGKKIRVRRIHLEEDTAKLFHPKGMKYSLLDFNRAGRPLMELVTEPDIATGREAKLFCEEAQRIFRYLAISDADMEKGQMRCEVNISLAPETEKEKLGTKVEVKNLNSFRTVERAIDYEIKRQERALRKNKKIIQETRGWNEKTQKTVSQRIKEEAEDYRYFPEPDLPALDNLSAWADELKNALPELPASRRKRFGSQYGLPENDIEVLINDKGLADYFESIVSELDTWAKIKSISDKKVLVKLTANYVLTELQKLLQVNKTEVADCKISPENFAELITLIHQGDVSSSGGQMVLKEMFETGIDPTHIIGEKELKQVSDESALEGIIKKVINENQKSIIDYKAGKEKALQFLIGQVMKESRGQANPQVVSEMLRKNLGQ